MQFGFCWLIHADFSGLIWHLKLSIPATLCGCQTDMKWKCLVVPDLWLMFLYQYKCRQLCFTKGYGKCCIQHKGDIHWQTKPFPFALYSLLKSWLLVEGVATVNWLGLLTLLAFPRTDPASRHAVSASKTSSFQIPSSIPFQTWGILSVQFSHLSLFSAHHLCTVIDCNARLLHLLSSGVEMLWVGT